METQLSNEPSTAQLVGEALDSARALARAEVRLAAAELGTEATRVLVSVTTFAIAVICAVIALIMFGTTIAVAAGGDAVLALCVGACLSVAIALVASVVGYRLLPKRFLERTRNSVERDVEYVKESLS